MRTRIATLILFSVCALPAMADEAEDAARIEQQKQEAFRAGFTTIIESLNLGTFELFAKSVDHDEFLNRVFGLRLIDQRIKKDFIERAQLQFESVVRPAFSDSTEGIKATVLGIESRGERGRALVRFDLPGLQFSYHEYELRLDRKNRVIVVDWVDYLRGERYTDGLGTVLVMASPSTAAARKLIDYQIAKESDMFQFTELLKAARDRRADRYVEILNGLRPEIQRQRVVVLTSVQLAKQIRNRRMLRTMLVQMAEHFPEEPLYSLMLLDYYVPSKMFAAAADGLRRTYDKFGFDDAAMEARLSALTLEMGSPADANAMAERAIELEPGLELAWWSAFRARVALADFAAAVAAVQTLEERFGHTLGRAELERDPTFAPLLASAEFAARAASAE